MENCKWTKYTRKQNCKWTKYARKQNPPFCKISSKYNLMLNVTATEYLLDAKRVDLFFDKKELRMTAKINDSGDYAITRQPERRSCSICIQGIINQIANINKNKRYHVEQIENGFCVILESCDFNG